MNKHFIDVIYTSIDKNISEETEKKTTRIIYNDEKGNGIFGSTDYKNTLLDDGTVLNFSFPYIFMATVKDKRKTGTIEYDYIRRYIRSDKWYSQVRFKTIKNYCIKLFKYYNKKYFNNQLIIPTIMIFYNDSTFYNKDIAGYYEFHEQILRMSAMQNKIDFNKVLLHEMCHMAVKEITKGNYWTKGGHGKDWQDWMEKVGLPTNHGVT